MLTADHRSVAFLLDVLLCFTLFVSCCLVHSEKEPFVSCSFNNVCKITKPFVFVLDLKGEKNKGSKDNNFLSVRTKLKEMSGKEQSKEKN